MVRVVVDVMPKPEILDPQGQAVAGALARLGISGVADVRQGKHFELDVDESVDDETLHRIAGNLLANPVIEDWTVTRG
ncbi:MAG: phosphoribosylformylglycinamidine synthase subunit PurS [Pseudonocardia sp.]